MKVAFLRRFDGVCPVGDLPGPQSQRSRRRRRIDRRDHALKSKYSSGGPIAYTAKRFALASNVGPLGTAQLSSTPPASRRKS